MIVPYI